MKSGENCAQIMLFHLQTVYALVTQTWAETCWRSTYLQSHITSGIGSLQHDERVYLLYWLWTCDSIDVSCSACWISESLKKLYFQSASMQEAQRLQHLLTFVHYIFMGVMVAKQQQQYFWVWGAVRETTQRLSGFWLKKNKSLIFSCSACRKHKTLNVHVKYFY